MRFKGDLPYLLSNISSLLCSWNGKSHQGVECYILPLPITTYGLLSPLQGPLDHNAVSPPPLSSIRSISRQDGLRPMILLVYPLLKTSGSASSTCHFGLSLPPGLRSRGLSDPFPRNGGATVDCMQVQTQMTPHPLSSIYERYCSLPPSVSLVFGFPQFRRLGKKRLKLP